MAAQVRPMTALRWLANSLRQKSTIGWLFGWFAAVLYVRLDLAFGWRFAIAVGFALCAGAVSGLIGRCG